MWYYEPKRRRPQPCWRRQRFDSNVRGFHEVPATNDQRWGLCQTLWAVRAKPSKKYWDTWRKPKPNLQSESSVFEHVFFSPNVPWRIHVCVEWWTDGFVRKLWISQVVAQCQSEHPDRLCKVMEWGLPKTSRPTQLSFQQSGPWMLNAIRSEFGNRSWQRKERLTRKLSRWASSWIHW